MHKTGIILKSIITCPYCGHKEIEIIPTDSCQFFYECKKCHKILKPEEGLLCEILDFRLVFMQVYTVINT